MSDHIPTEIIVEILHKLPIKDILRFTCVSRTWLSLIKSRSFISTHLTHSISSSNNDPQLLLRLCRLNPALVLTEYYTVCRDTELFTYDSYIHFHFPFETLVFNLVGAVNGLVCLTDDIDSKRTVIIWNPWIKKSITLPEPMSTCNKSVSYGFGFNSRSHDYKVLRLAQPLSGRGDTLEGEVYSFNTNSWTRVCPPSCLIMPHSKTAFVNGVVHGLASRVVGDDKSCKLIWGFDMGDDTFREIPLLQTLVDRQHMSMKLFVFEDSIALFEEDWSSGRFYVWAMRVYGDLDSWSRILSFDEQEGAWPRVFGFRKNGELFLQMPDREIVLQEYENPESRSLQVRGSFPFVNSFVESLELLDHVNAQSDPTVAND